MRFNKRNFCIFLLIISLIVIAFLPCKIIFSKAEENNNDLAKTEEYLNGEENKSLLSDDITDQIDLNNENYLDEQILMEYPEDIENEMQSNEENGIKDNSGSLIQNESTQSNIKGEDEKNSSEKVTSSNNTNEGNLQNNSASEISLDSTNAEYSLNATLYDTNQYAGGTGTKLTEEGVEINGWNYTDSKYLQIDPVVPADGNTYVVKVKLPQEFYIVGSEIATPAGYQKVEFTKNEPLKVNKDGTYNLNTYSGTAEYTMNYMGESGTIQLEIRYDTTLWDKQENSPLTAEGINPIEVSLIRKDESNKGTELSKVFVNKVKSGEKLKCSCYQFVYLSGHSIYEDINVVNKEQQISFAFQLKYSDYSSYYSKMILNINLPYYEDASKNKYYLLPDMSSIKFPYNFSYSIDSKNLYNDGILKITFENIYFAGGSILISMDFYPLSEQLLNIEENSFLFSKGEYNIIGEKNRSFEIARAGIKGIIYEKELSENVSSAVTSRSITILDRPKDAVSLLGGFYLMNNGTGDSCAKTIFNEFDSENTNLIKVTTINTMADNVQEYIDISYTLIDDYGNRIYEDVNGNRVSENSENAIGEWIYSIKNTYYNSTITGNLNNRLQRNMLPQRHQKYYFKTIKYTIQTIKANMKLYQPGAPKNKDVGGNFFGYVDDESALDNQSVANIMQVTSSNSIIEPLSARSSILLQKKLTPSYQLTNFNMSKKVIQAGESFTISGRIENVIYPYGNSEFLRDIYLGIVLSESVTINEQSVFLSTQSGIDITDFEISSKSLENGNVLWIIKVSPEFYVGLYSEDLSSLKYGDFINFNVQLDTSYTMNNITLFAKDMVFATGYNQSNAAGGSYIWTSKVDQYDLNENGSTTDYISGLRETDTTNCQIIAQSATIDVEDSISINRQGNITEEVDKVSISNQTDIVNYNLDISCFSGGQAEGFYYYIPIPKNDSVADNFIIEEGSNGKFDFSINAPVSLSGSDILELQYTFENRLTYEKAKEVTSWYTYEQIEQDNNLKLEDVTMIKVTIKGEGIQNGDKVRLTVPLKYSGNTFAEEAGMQNIWHSGGYFHYVNGDRETAGNYKTSGVTVDLKTEQELDPITLTAAKDMSPQIAGNVNSITIDSSKFPQFKNSQNFKITSVSTYNAVLQTESYIKSNLDMAGIDANKTFAITVAMKGGTGKNILSNVQTTPVEVGSIGKNSSPEFTFKLYNANAISDNSQTRYILVTLTSDNGVTIKQRININIEPAKATDPQVSIVAGKRYLVFDDVSESVTISQDSAFTTQFILEYIPINYKEPQIVFSNTLPAGTNLILENLTDESNPTYWYYKVGSSISNIKLAEFNKMGRTSDEKYTNPTGTDLINQKLLIIVDFSECNSGYIPIGNYIVKMTIPSNNDAIEELTTKELKFITSAQRSFAISNATNANIGEEFAVNYSMQKVAGAESKYEGRKISLVITAPENIPADTNIMVGENSYYLNANNQFIIPLGDMDILSNSVKMKINSQILPDVKTDYELKMELYVSATANSEAPLLGERVGISNITISTDEKILPSLKVKNMSKRVIHKEELTNTLELTYEYIEKANCKVTVEMQQKIGTAYQKLTDKLSSVNGITNHELGAFNLNSTNGENRITFNLSSTTRSRNI